MGKIMKSQMDDILVVDDNTMVRTVLSELLEENGYTVRTAAHGFEALALVRCRVPDVLLSDLNMPRMSGFELLSIVRCRFPMVAAIAMSGIYSDSTMTSGIAADAFYDKGSISIFRLIEIIHAIADAEERQSQRVTAPVWIHGATIHSDDMSMTAVACPECLRVFWHPLRGNLLQQPGSHCPHCLQPMQFAIARQSEDIDMAGLTISTPQNMVLGSAMQAEPVRTSFRNVHR